MSNYKHNTPTFNTDRKVANFNDFVSNLPSELEELKKVKRSFRHEQGEVGNIPNKSKYKYNKVTHKNDELSKDMIQDKIDAIEEPVEESLIKNFSNFK